MSVDRCPVLLLWRPEPRLLEYLRHALRDDGVELRVPGDEVSPEELCALAPGARVFVGWKASEEVFIAAPELELFINPGAGVQHHLESFRAQRASGRHVRLCNDHGNASQTAQHTVALLLSACQGLVTHDRWLRAGRWRLGDKELAATPLAGRRVGLLGFGAVNRAVATLLRGFEPELSIYRRSSRQGLPAGTGAYGPGQLDAFLDAIEVLVIAVPLTAETRGLIDARCLERLGPRGVVVNVARGAVVDEEALYEALSERRIASAAIDVWYDYRPEADAEGLKRPYSQPFHELDNLVMSPHRAASPFAELGRWDGVIENIRRFASGEQELLNEVDVERGY